MCVCACVWVGPPPPPKRCQVVNNTPTKRKPRLPRGQKLESAASGTLGGGSDGDQTAAELEESPGDGSAEVGLGPDTAPTPPPENSRKNLRKFSEILG